ncbi:hypothetical protein FOZ60_001869 [Perkinsus olseni]|uniref:Uncharacterized protein n=1 Tax=Perkinsus olseni TaxID=32597 RepID=A0A7J6PL46_PEROL|nr:hypothetical protein FOZ60_001869 [Perkinsus olseni]
MASLFIDPLPSVRTLKRHLCVKIEDNATERLIYSDTDEALDRCVTGVMEEIRQLPLGKAEAEELHDEASYSGGSSTTGPEVVAKVDDPRGFWNGLTGDDFDDPDKVESIRSLVRYPLKSGDDDPLVVEIKLSWPLYNGDREVFMHEGRLYTTAPIPRPLQVYANSNSRHKETMRCVPVYCQHYLPGPLPTLSEIWHQNPRAFWPLLHSAREISRSAKLGMIGWFMGARHTVIAFDTDYSDRKYRGACERGCPGIGSHLLLDKTADGGVWFRYRAFWEKFNEEGPKYPSKGDDVRLSDVWESTRKIDNGVMVDGGMTIDRCCQHFTTGVLRRLISDGKMENIEGVKPELRNKEIFDAFNRIRERHPWWYPKGVEAAASDPSAEGWQQNLMRIYNSGGFSSYIHELISSWRLRISLYQIPDF